MRLLHTADWHLGRCFHGTRLIEDQRHILAQFVELAADARPDAILIAGDVYDRALPAPDAVELLDDVLSRLILDLHIPVVLIAGNHDSPVRLDFASGVLGRQGLHVAGSYAPIADGISFEDKHGEVIVHTLPYAEPAAVRQSIADCGLRIAESSNAESGIFHSSNVRCPMSNDECGKTEGAEEGIENHNGAVRAAVGFIRARHPAGKRGVIVGHAFVSGGLATADSERPLSVGGAECVDPAVFEGFQYVALGHLHQPQSIGGDGGGAIHYAGSLLKYSFAEAAHRKAVCLVEMDGEGRCTVERIPLSPRRDVRRIEGELDELLRSAPPSDDYLLVTLLDRGALHDPLGRLRERFPNVLQIIQPVMAAGEAVPALDPGAIDEPMETLFNRFFETVTGEAPTTEELKAFCEVAGAVERTAREG